jgi:hypothetical protein
LTASSDPEVNDSTSVDQYAGWIPTANGRLSFRHLGETRHPTPSKYANVATAVDRYILVYQRRDLSDSVFRTITDRVCRRSGDFWFALVAKSAAAPDNVDGSLSGTIFVFKSKEDWRTGPQDKIRTAINEMNTARLSLASDRDQVIEQSLLYGRMALVESADVWIDFVLERNGELRVDRPVFRDADLAYASRAFATREGHDFDKWIADQGYFFLRDIAHQHQHHDHAVDTILILQRKDDADISWRRNILFSLQFYIISNRRSRDARALVQAKGILAYFESFLGICRSRLKEQFDQIPSFETDALRNSLEASIEERALERLAKTEQSANTSNFRVTVLAVVAPTLALIGVALQPHIGGPENLRDFPTLNHTARFISNYAVEILAITVLFATSAMAIHFATASLAKRGSYSRQLLALGIANERAAFFASLLIAVASAGVGMYFGRASLVELLELFERLFVR